MKFKIKRDIFLMLWSLKSEVDMSNCIPVHPTLQSLLTSPMNKRLSCGGDSDSDCFLTY